MEANSFKIPFIGKRKLKSLLAVTLVFAFWQLVRLIFPWLEIHPGLAYVYAVVFLVCTVWHTTEDIFIYIIMRMFQTVLGVGAAYLLNRFAFPEKEAENQEENPEHNTIF